MENYFERALREEECEFVSRVDDDVLIQETKEWHDAIMKLSMLAMRLFF